MIKKKETTTATLHLRINGDFNAAHGGIPLLVISSID